jgi:hypothetical protein
VQLPPGFEPTRIGVEMRSARDPNHGFRQAFIWKAQGMSMETEAPGEEPGGLGAAFPGTPGGGVNHPEGAKSVQAETE